MKTYRITARTSIEVKTVVEANSEEEAIKVVRDGEREVSICIHGTDDSDALENWVYTDWPDFNFTDEYTEEIDSIDF